jgi:hypothetical protein
MDAHFIGGKMAGVKCSEAQLAPLDKNRLDWKNAGECHKTTGGDVRRHDKLTP